MRFFHLPFQLLDFSLVGFQTILKYIFSAHKLLASGESNSGM